MIDPIDGLATAIARIDRENQSRDEKLDIQFSELEHHAERLQNRV
jgi:hypothetical protein